MGSSISLGNVEVVSGGNPYVIAEIGVNHEGSMTRAKELISQAKEGGASAAKFQSYKAETLASRHSPAYWNTAKEPTQSQYQLFKKYDAFSSNDYIELSQHCKNVGIDFISTPFDDEAVDFLEPIVPYYKIASADITNIPFLRKIASKRKPVVLSTGASSLSEIDTAVKVLEVSGCSEIALLHCILNYPTDDVNANLSMITGLKSTYPNRVIGYSDHTLPDDGMTTLVSAFLLGAIILEKHFTHDKQLPGNDHYHAMDLEDLKRFMSAMNKIQNLLGSTEHKAPIDSEDSARKHARRSIVVKTHVKKGQILQETDLTYKRPGTGISPAQWDSVVGMVATRDLNDDDILTWGDLDKAP